MTLNDIKKAVCEGLSAHFNGFKVYSENVEQGAVKPCFFVRVIPITTNLLSMYRQKVMTVKITYLNDAKKQNQDRYTIAEELEKLFSGILTVGERSLYILSSNVNETDDFMIYSFTLNYAIGEDEPDAEYMIEEIEITEL